MIACAIFEPPLNFQFEIDATADDQNGLITEILTWAERRRVVATDNTDVVRAYEWLGDDTISTTALDSDPARIAMLVQNGYAPRDEEVSFRTARSLADPLPPPNLPAGASFRSMTNADEEARSELHRDAWSVWGESKHDRERYHRLRSAPLYDPDLDVVLDVDGQLVSYCVCWPDAVNKIGLFEPVGTRPSATRRGYGRTVLHEAFRRLRAKGMNTAIVSTGTVNKPAQALYASAGFKPVAREVTYTKTLP